MRVPVHPAVLGLLPALVACAGQGRPDPVPAAMTKSEAERVLKPYRAGWAVACDRLEIEMTANFGTEVVRPGHDPQHHDYQHEEDDEAIENVWTNVSGGEQRAFQLRIADTELRVFGRVRIRVLKGTHPFTLRSVATGNVLVARNGEPEMVERFEIADGGVRTP